jgi:hypothetical protein
VLCGNPEHEKRLGEEYALFSATPESVLFSRQGCSLGVDSLVRGQGLLLEPVPPPVARQHDDVVRSEEWASIHACSARVSVYVALLNVVSTGHRQFMMYRRSLGLRGVICKALLLLDNVWKDVDMSLKKAAVEGRLRSMIVSTGNLFMCVRCQLVLCQLKRLLEEAAIKASHVAATRARAAFDAWLQQALAKGAGPAHRWVARMGKAAVDSYKVVRDLAPRRA